MIRKGGEIGSYILRNNGSERVLLSSKYSKSTISFIQPESQGNHKPVPAGTKSIWTLKVHFRATGRNSNSRARICKGIQIIHAKEKAVCWPEAEQEYKKTLELQLPLNPCHTNTLWSTGTYYLSDNFLLRTCLCVGIKNTFKNLHSQDDPFHFHPVPGQRPTYFPGKIGDSSAPSSISPV